jgi:hypothetical protein
MGFFSSLSLLKGKETDNAYQFFDTSDLLNWG